MSLRSTLLRVYWAMRGVIAPKLRYSQESYEDVLTQHVQIGTRWIDIGCGHSILPPWRLEKERRLAKTCQVVAGIDYDLDSLKSHSTISWRIRGDIRRLPFKEESFDLVTANMVVEHLDSPEGQFLDINRILRPKGCFVFHTPNARGHAVLMSRLVPDWLKGKLIYLLDGRLENDVFETHYMANTEKEVIALARVTGFEVENVELITTDAVFSSVPPIAFFELLWIRALMTESFRSLRTTMIVVLRKVS